MALVLALVNPHAGLLLIACQPSVEGWSMKCLSGAALYQNRMAIHLPANPIRYSSNVQLGAPLPAKQVEADF